MTVAQFSGFNEIKTMNCLFRDPRAQIHSTTDGLITTIYLIATQLDNIVKFACNVEKPRSCSFSFWPASSLDKILRKGDGEND